MCASGAPLVGSCAFCSEFHFVYCHRKGSCKRIFALTSGVWADTSVSSLTILASSSMSIAPIRACLRLQEHSFFDLCFFHVAVVLISWLMIPRLPESTKITQDLSASSC